ncbi:diguanylate cyclase domain-containing protein [Cryptosporangium phraense]|uniref:Diguanylate cyclase n=1 Tax=Cryptosporangium phraense TaxID=2593070 RepID=A0A545AS39_9ACTN|nr:diguanylate cyclase [Cryptosporangium phraense]TQS44061.1 diguanylate cyclase [Cryptosporangium phraense]
MPIREHVGKRGRAGVALVAAVLLAGCLVTYAAFDAVDRAENRYAGQVMDRYADEVSAAVDDRVQRYSETLQGLASAVGAQSDLRREDYTKITAGLDSWLSGAAGIGFAVPATAADLPAVQRTWRAHGATGLTLRPSPGVDRHVFVVFERTLDGRSDIAGLDLAQRAEPAEALREAQQTSGFTISPAYHLLRDRALPARVQQNSLLFCVPVYRGLGSDDPDVFVGWITMPVRGQDFLTKTLSDRGQGAVQARLAQVGAGSPVLASVSPGVRVHDDDLVRRRTVVVGQQRWELTTWPTSRLLAATDRGMSRFTLAAGAALTLMLAVMTGVLAGSRSRALQQVDQATAALRLDITRRKHVEAQLRERERELHHLAFHDPLTGLANRTLFYDRLIHALDTHARNGGLVGVLFVDLDGFKQVNDRLGHAAGDVVLLEVAERLRTGLRAVDTVARFGGDEFAILLEGLTTPVNARTAAERVIADVQAPILIDGAPAHVSASIGIAIGGPGDDADDLIREADAAMYEAKSAGKNCYVEA